LTLRLSFLGLVNPTATISVPNLPSDHGRNITETGQGTSIYMNRRASDELLLKAFAKFDKIALGTAVGLCFGSVVFLITALLILKGGEQVGPNLELLGQFFIGYEVTWGGGFVGLIYGFVVGFVFGFFLAALRNGFVFVYLAVARAREERRALQTFLDEM